MIEKAKAMMKLEARLDAMLERVRLMEPGGDLEGLLEEETAQLKCSVYEAAIEQRHQTVEQTDFPPSVMSALRGRPDAPGGSPAASDSQSGREAELRARHP